MQGYLKPPQNPEECIFAKTTECLSADLKRAITPCQYGGDPDCTQCGCMASVGDYTVCGGVLPLPDGRWLAVGSIACGGVDAASATRRGCELVIDTATGAVATAHRRR